MTITLHLPPEAEQTLLSQAKARGLSLDAFLQTIITNQAASAATVKPLQTLPREGEDVDRSIDEIFDTFEIAPGIGEGAMRRENWYR